MGFSPGLVRHGYIAQWLERLTADQQVPGSNLGVPFYFARYLWNVAFPLSVASSSWRLTFSCALAWLWLFFVNVWASPGSCLPLALVSCANSQVSGGSSGPRKAPKPLLGLRSCSSTRFLSQLAFLCSHWRPEIQIYCHKRGGHETKGQKNGAEGRAAAGARNGRRRKVLGEFRGRFCQNPSQQTFWWPRAVANHLRPEKQPERKDKGELIGAGICLPAIAQLAERLTVNLHRHQKSAWFAIR